MPSGSLTALLGPSGSGKSTLLRIIGGLEAPDSGRVVINGEDATFIQPQKREIGFVFQHYAAFKHMTVRDNVAFGLTIASSPSSRSSSASTSCLRVVGLAGYAKRYPAASCRAASASGWRWRARCRSSRECCCSTSRSARSTRRSAPSCASGCGGFTTRST